MRLLVMAVVLAGAAVHAATPDGPCTADIARLCKDTAKGEGRLRACLLEHENELAAECRARITGGAAKGPAMDAQQMLTCRADLETHCAKVPSGGGRLRACLQEHEAALKPACKAALARPARKR
jgi:hypothetical protein